MEATAIGNVLVQARAQGFATGSLESLRALVQRAYPPRSFRPDTSVTGSRTITFHPRQSDGKRWARVDLHDIVSMLSEIFTIVGLLVGIPLYIVGLSVRGFGGRWVQTDGVMRPRHRAGHPLVRHHR